MIQAGIRNAMKSSCDECGKEVIYEKDDDSGLASIEVEPTVRKELCEECVSEYRDREKRYREDDEGVIATPDEQAQFMYDMSEQLKQALEVLHFDESLTIIEHHILKLIGEGTDNELSKIVGAIREYRERRLSVTVPGYSALRAMKSQ
jgi:hypothetical protein